MCSGIKILEGDKVAHYFETVGALCEFFKFPNIRFLGTEDFAHDRKWKWPAPEDANSCLCPIDIDYLLKQTGYKLIPTTDPRYDVLDISIEKI